ncbi:hypothetical protein GUITHDRAFT_116817 [Guillardia theta CCMP2712]|uniref:Uncharacterized protein n=1 Tax=Guillardia theta (strain CCMP2712) TaxID=905079 RepID=L1IMC7_GUITC|nr:hypothetical protein GUITHDRAFT_116817 [Guillardia theta CCMP2712]EKX36950.1 hypothetical protein GUITHDRAFT_116817 [Guillardia theta CCMP2712]|eukprot:XP_005823930.1 hypothetical protein GUITHDRAFT_116817 [Guillardia theta CCMP2712]
MSLWRGGAREEAEEDEEEGEAKFLELPDFLNPLSQLSLLNLVTGPDSGGDGPDDESQAEPNEDGGGGLAPGKSTSKQLDYYWTRRMEAVIAAEKMVEAAKAKALEIDRKTDDIESKIRTKLMTAKSEVTRIVSAQRFRSLKWSHSVNQDKDDLEQTMLYFHEKLDAFEVRLAFGRPSAPKIDFGVEFDETFRRKVIKRRRRSSVVSMEDFGRMQDSKALVEDYDSPGGSDSDQEGDRKQGSNNVTVSRKTIVQELGNVSTPEEAEARLKLIRRELETRLHEYSNAAGLLEKTNRHHAIMKKCANKRIMIQRQIMKVEDMLKKIKRQRMVHKMKTVKPAMYEQSYDDESMQ